METRSRLDGPGRMRRALLATLTCLVVAAPACQRAPDTRLISVLRLTSILVTPPAPGAPASCPLDQDIRPALGCLGQVRLFRRGLPLPDDGRIDVDTKIPGHVRGQPLLLEPAVIDAFKWRELPTSIFAGDGERLSLPLDIGTLSAAITNAEIRVHGRPLPRRPVTHATRLTEIPARAVLSVAIGAEKIEADGAAAEVEFIVRVGNRAGGSNRREILRETIEVATAGGRWHERRIPLHDLAGETVSFSFEARGVGAPADRPVAVPLWGSPQLLAPESRDQRPNVLLISLDTVRGDHVGPQPTTTGEAESLTPILDGYAARGTRFTQALTTFPSTSASHMSLFTGLYPVAHGIETAWNVLDRSVPTIGEIFAAGGYRTAAVTENGMISAGSGFARGFDHYRENRQMELGAGAIESTLGYAEDWLRAHGDERFLLFVHTYEAHNPYAPPEGFRPEQPAAALRGRTDPRFEADAALYAGEIRYSDGLLRSLFDLLRELQIDSETIVVVTADHGEEFGEHGRMGHSRTGYEELLRIPLLIWGPGRVQEGRVVDEPVSLVDLAPTITDLVGLPFPVRRHGRSLARVLRGEPMGPARTLFAQAPAYQDPGGRLVVARTAERKWIMREKTGVQEAYDLTRDPHEMRPLEDDAAVADGQKLLDQYLALADRQQQPKGRRSLDDETRHKLKALGYTE